MIGAAFFISGLLQKLKKANFPKFKLALRNILRDNYLLSQLSNKLSW